MGMVKMTLSEVLDPYIEMMRKSGAAFVRAHTCAFGTTAEAAEVATHMCCIQGCI